VLVGFDAPDVVGVLCAQVVDQGAQRDLELVEMSLNFFSLSKMMRRSWRYDIQHNATQHNVTQHTGLVYDTQHK